MLRIKFLKKITTKIILTGDSNAGNYITFKDEDLHITILFIVVTVIIFTFYYTNDEMQRLVSSPFGQQDGGEKLFVTRHRHLVFLVVYEMNNQNKFIKRID